MGRRQQARKNCAKEALETVGASGEVSSTEGAEKPKTMSFLRSRLYKAKSLGSLVKERILVEASHCHYELWKRLGVRKSATRKCPKMADKSAIVQPVPQHCSSC